MPSLFTHYLCGHKCLALLNNKELKHMLNHYRQVFNLGTQGPDIFFYYRVWPWTNSCGLDALGERIHEEHVNDFFSSALQYIMKQNTPDRDLLMIYLCGYACHYSLDLFAHPYIFYKTGFVRQGEAPTSQYTYYHRRFETAVDVLMLKHILTTTPCHLRGHELIKVPHEAALTIGKMYEYILQQVFLQNIPAPQTAHAIIDMITVQSVLRDRSGLKKKLLYFTEQLLGHYPLMSSMIHPASVKDGLDYLNMKHRSWHLPWDGSYTYTSTFIELFDKAVLESAALSNIIYNCIMSKEDTPQGLKKIGNRSFSTGIDCRIPVVFQYYDCIFDSES
ncbi:MAG: zinc dependent phospholipase C family protein [Bacillota bacterium]